MIRIAATQHPRGEFGRPEDKRGGRALVLWSKNPAEEPFRFQQSDHPIVCEGCFSECQNWNVRENCRPTIFLKQSFSTVDSRVHPKKKCAKTRNKLSYALPSEGLMSSPPSCKMSSPVRLRLQKLQQEGEGTYLRLLLYLIFGVRRLAGFIGCRSTPRNCFCHPTLLSRMRHCGR